MEGTGQPDYERCVAISTQSSLREMILPGVLVRVVVMIIVIILLLLLLFVVVCFVLFCFVCCIDDKMICYCPMLEATLSDYHLVKLNNLFILLLYIYLFSFYIYILIVKLYSIRIL